MRDIVKRLDLARVRRTVEAGARVEKRVFYSRYERYCQDMRVPPKALQNITDDLEAMFPVKQVKPKAGGKRLRAYEGIRFRDEMLPRVYQVANADLADLGFGFEALRCDEHGWPIPRFLIPTGATVILYFIKIIYHLFIARLPQASAR